MYNIHTLTILVLILVLFISMPVLSDGLDGKLTNKWDYKHKSNKITCIVEKKVVCSREIEEICQDAEISENNYRWIYLDTKTINIGSDQHGISIDRSGIFKIIRIGTGSAFIKISTYTGEFFEQRDFLLGSYLSWGSCSNW